MSITAAIVLFTVIWFMVFFMVLPLRLQSQAEGEHIVPGTSASAPVEAHIAKKAKLTSLIAVVIWGIATAVILSGWITIRDLDVFDRMGPAADTRTE